MVIAQVVLTAVVTVGLLDQRVQVDERLLVSARRRIQLGLGRRHRQRGDHRGVARFHAMREHRARPTHLLLIAGRASLRILHPADVLLEAFVDRLFNGVEAGDVGVHLFHALGIGNAARALAAGAEQADQGDGGGERCGPCAE